MLGKRSRPVIGKLAGTLRSGAAGDSAVSPRSPLDFKPTHSPKSFFSDHGGVGLGIIVSLDKSAKKGGQILPKYSVSGRSKPIAVISRAAAAGGGSGCGGEGSLEDYTYVTCRGPGNKAVTRVYYDAGGDRKMNLCAGDEKTVAGVFRISPARSVEVGCPSDFLSSCHLCRKALHGKDIYMYRGEKAFCSVECRQKQMVMDERKELCRSEASRTSGEVPYSTSSATSSGGGLVFSTGIIAI